MFATLVRFCGSWDLAEECAQDAFEQALRSWPVSGVPSRPGAWLTTVARRRALDRLRRAGVELSKYEEVAAVTHAPDDASEPRDDRLALIFTCCHPALSLDAQVALTLRTLAGLTTTQIARAFLVSDETMAKRLVRAKAKIAHAAIPYRVPPDYQLVERTVAVLGVIYLLFNEGYSATSGDALVRGDLVNEAVRLARLLVELMPDEPEARGLLALALLHDARRDARVDASGALVALDEQDRSRWDAANIAEGLASLDAALRQRRAGPYQVQAAIAACHAVAARAVDTDWGEIAQLYDQLLAMVPSPVVELNRAVAIAMAKGPLEGLRLVDDLVERGGLVDYPFVAATRADLLRRSQQPVLAASEYERAIAEARTAPERAYLQRRLEEVRSTAP
ncbi:MAG: RNA polymerase sigma factor [Acidimicrobiales bacterium]